MATPTARFDDGYGGFKGGHRLLQGAYRSVSDIVICSYLEPEHVSRIRAASQGMNVHYHPDLLPRPRYAADHVGAPFARTPEQVTRWREILGRARVCFDFDHVAPEEFRHHARYVDWIQATSAGIGQTVCAYGLDELGATLTTAAGVHARPLAEFVVWSMLSFAKEYPRARRQQRQHVWERFHTNEIAGATLAIVGLGSIGREVARLTSALGVRVIGSKRVTTGIEPAELGVEALHPVGDLSGMLAEADYVCLAAPHTPATEGMIDCDAMAAMKRGSVLINIGRGALVQETALVDALRHGPIKGAVLDVAPEEPLPATHPLWEMDNVILFPHSASTSAEENRRLTDLFLDNLQRYRAGRPLRNVFDPSRMY